MLNVREPILHPVEIVTLQPTQITVGMREVHEKRKRWRKNPDNKKSELLGRHMIPVIFGPKDRYFVIDHHHLARALHDEGEKGNSGEGSSKLRQRRLLDGAGPPRLGASL